MTDVCLQQLLTNLKAKGYRPTEAFAQDLVRKVTRFADNGASPEKVMELAMKLGQDRLRQAQVIRRAVVGKESPAKQQDDREKSRHADKARIRHAAFDHRLDFRQVRHQRL